MTVCMRSIGLLAAILTAGTAMAALDDGPLKVRSGDLKILVSKVYPDDFTGAVPPEPGFYIVVWEIDGGFVACHGFEVKRPGSTAPDARAERASADHSSGS